MNYKKFFDVAKENGILTSEIRFYKETATRFSVFHHELDNYSISSQSSISARGIYNGKLGVGSTEDISSGTFNYLVNSIKESAGLVEKKEEPIFYPGSKKYYKKNVYSKSLSLTPVDDKIKMIYALEKAAYDADKRVIEVQVEYEEEDSESVLLNSLGLNLKNKGNDFAAVLSVVCKDGDEVKSGFDVKLGSDISTFNPEEFAKKVVDETVAKFHGKSLKSKTYKCVLSSDTVATFLTAMVNAGLSAEEVQKKSSLLTGKLNEKVFSNKITVMEKPLEKNVFFRYFDSEGVATTNKTIIDKGVIKSYLYNLETAKKDGVEPTGNGAKAGGKIGIRANNLYLKPGRLTEEELFNKCKNGVYITSVTGIHSGLNAQSGSFSMEGEGFFIEDGKKTGPITLITVGGNIYDLFKEVLAVGSNAELKLNSTTAPSILVKGLKVSSL